MLPLDVHQKHMVRHMREKIKINHYLAEYIKI